MERLVNGDNTKRGLRERHAAGRPHEAHDRPAPVNDHVRQPRHDHNDQGVCGRRSQHSEHGEGQVVAQHVLLIGLPRGHLVRGLPVGLDDPVTDEMTRDEQREQGHRADPLSPESDDVGLMVGTSRWHQRIASGRTPGASPQAGPSSHQRQYHQSSDEHALLGVVGETRHGPLVHRILERDL